MKNILLRVAFIKYKDEPDKILTILRVNAILENGKWVLQNTINDYLNNWTKNIPRQR